ncbi:MAG: thiamine phosphate synthase [Pseudomonadota bacterium]
MALKTSSHSRRKLLMAARSSTAVSGPDLPPVWVLTDPERMPDPVVVAETLPRGWGMIYRHFGAPEKRGISSQLRIATDQRNCWLLIAADPLLAFDVGADGVHWPEAFRRQARKWRGTFPIMTTSSHSPKALRTASAAVFDGSICSTVFPSRSRSAGHPMGETRFRVLARSAGLPVYGLGGVNSGTAGRIARFAGLAMVDGGMSKA